MNIHSRVFRFTSKNSKLNLTLNEIHRIITFLVFFRISRKNCERTRISKMIPTATYFQRIDLRPILPPADSIYFKTHQVTKNFLFLNNKKKYSKLLTSSAQCFRCRFLGESSGETETSLVELHTLHHISFPVHSVVVISKRSPFHGLCLQLKEINVSHSRITSVCTLFDLFKSNMWFENKSKVISKNPFWSIFFHFRHSFFIVQHNEIQFLSFFVFFRNVRRNCHWQFSIVRRFFGKKNCKTWSRIQSSKVDRCEKSPSGKRHRVRSIFVRWFESIQHLSWREQRSKNFSATATESIST